MCVCARACWYRLEQDGDTGLRGGPGDLARSRTFKGSKISDYVRPLFSTSYKRCLMWKERKLALTELLLHASEKCFAYKILI